MTLQELAYPFKYKCRKNSRDNFKATGDVIISYVLFKRMQMLFYNYSVIHQASISVVDHSLYWLSEVQTRMDLVTDYFSTIDSVKITSM